MVNNVSFYYSWLRGHADELDALRARRQLPHAVLIHGPAGTGRRHLALWLGARVLDAPDPDPSLAADPEAGIALTDELLHPDLMVAQPPPDKQMLPIDTVRQLIEFLQLTAHQGHGKVAILAPAEAMSHAAANSLLKTLEEPPAGSLIVLVASAPGRLPATVVSRCHRIRIGLPDQRQAATWLKTAHGDADWLTALELGGGAPLTAARLHGAGFGAEAERLEAEFIALGRAEADPVAVARRWAKLGAGRVLDWLYRRIGKEIRSRSLSGEKRGTGSLQNGQDVLNISRLHSMLRELGELRRQLGSGLNMELALAQLLDEWYGAKAPR
jgi:DNA polymerase-3 subunit delta'